MRTFLHVLVIVVLFVGGCHSISGKSSFRPGYDFNSLEKIAIVSVEGAVKGETAKDQIAEFFAMEFIDKGYAPIGRTQVKAFLSDEESESSDLTTAGKATTAGEILDVSAVLVVNVPHFDEEIAITAQLINVQDGSTLWMGRGSEKAGQSMPEAFIGTLTGKSSDSRAEAYLNQQVAMMSGEKQTEKALTTLEAEKIRKVVTRICSSLPARNLTNSVDAITPEPKPKAESKPKAEPKPVRTGTW